ncbi:hypothetical protein GCM10012275_02460 [Longimycelium tulufanense]|uniref:Uncharacterized protein n=1 Tax=Longimycelium tulufanense TaxID=907463 RepID=A0A8J3C9M5_9PSEU|nr:hypothetical protein [Longimycelium tulufanense]GGM34693.1 hypothetical protein GCM10012275_02460 [Longimycelium tulufanense]
MGRRITVEFTELQARVIVRALQFGLRVAHRFPGGLTEAERTALIKASSKVSTALFYDRRHPHSPASGPAVSVPPRTPAAGPGSPTTKRAVRRQR